MPGTAGMVGHIRAGKLRALAVTGAKRSPQLPDVPTVAEAGVPGYEAYVWMGLLAPKGTQAAIIERLHRELIAVLASEEVQALHGRRRHRDRGLHACRSSAPSSAPRRPRGPRWCARPARASTDAARATVENETP